MTAPSLGQTHVDDDHDPLPNGLVAPSQRPLDEPRLAHQLRRLDVARPPHVPHDGLQPLSASVLEAVEYFPLKLLVVIPASLFFSFPPLIKASWMRACLVIFEAAFQSSNPNLD